MSQRFAGFIVRHSKVNRFVKGRGLRDGLQPGTRLDAFPRTLVLKLGWLLHEQSRGNG